MISHGIKSLGDFAIAAAGTFVGDWVSDLDGLLVAAAQLRFTGGSGGTSVKVYLQTSLDQGTTAVDVALEFGPGQPERVISVGDRISFESVCEIPPTSSCAV